jgi:hypothetical protein
VPIDPKRKGDIKVLVSATIAVLLVGFFIFAAMMVTSRGSSSPTCGRLRIGLASGVRDNLNHGPYFQTGGGDCGFFFALDNGDIVAYKVVQPSGCNVNWAFDHWECNGRRIAASRLATYPTFIRTEQGADTLYVNLGSPAPSTTTTTAAATSSTRKGA